MKTLLVLALLGGCATIAVRSGHDVLELEAGLAAILTAIALMVANLRQSPRPISGPIRFAIDPVQWRLVSGHLHQEVVHQLHQLQRLGLHQLYMERLELVQRVLRHQLPRLRHGLGVGPGPHSLQLKDSPRRGHVDDERGAGELHSRDRQRGQRRG